MPVTPEEAAAVANAAASAAAAAATAAATTSAKLDTHEQVCTIRYQALREDVGNLKGDMRRGLEKINGLLQKLSFSVGGILISALGYMIYHYMMVK